MTKTKPKLKSVSVKKVQFGAQKKRSTNKHSSKTAVLKGIKSSSKKDFLASLSAELNKDKKTGSLSKGTEIGLRDRLSLALLSPYRFPIDAERLAIQSARMVGMAFVFIGAFLTMWHLPVVHQELVKATESRPQLASLSGAESEYQNSATDFNTEETAVLQKPPVNINVSSNSDSTSYTINFGVERADTILVKAVNTDTGALHTLGRANRVSSNEWEYRWLTENFVAGDYAVYGEVTNAYGTYNSERKNITLREVANDTTDGDTAEASSVDTQEDAPDQAEAVETENEITLILADADNLNGIVELKLEALHTSYLELYVEPKFGGPARFIGLAGLKEKGIWSYRWNTANTPNGFYRLFAVGKIDGKKIVSPYKRIQVNNPISETKEEKTIIELSKEMASNNEPTDANGDTPEAIVPIKLTTDRTIVSPQMQKIRAEIEIVEGEYERRIPEPLKKEADDAVADPTPTETAEIELSLESLMSDYEVDIDNELANYKTAIRSGDETQIDLVKQKIDELKRTIIKNSFTIGNDELLAFTDRRLGEELELLQHHVFRTEAIIKERVGEALVLDTDNDGITDYDEVTLYTTDPKVADSDNDGFIDSAEILNGYNPKDESPEAVLVFESPQDWGLVREDILTINSIETVTQNKTDASETVVSVPTALIKGVALPNSFVTLYIFSTPIIVTVKTEADGSWEYTFDKELEDGEHEVYVGVTDNAGKIVAKSEPLQFIKTAEAFTSVANAEEKVATLATTQEENNFLTQNMILLVMSISIVLIGLVLIILGLHLHNRRGEHLVAEEYLATT